MIFKIEFQILLNLKRFTDVYSYYRNEKKTSLINTVSFT